MALVLKDRVRVTSSTTGTGTFTLGSAAAGFQDFSVIGDGNTTYYTIQNSGDNTWEVGIGTYTASGTTLSRDTVLESSNAGSLVNFAAGTKDVFVTYPAEKGLYLDASNNAIGLGTPASATLTNATGLPISTGVSGLGTGIATFLGTPSSSNLASAVTDETGSGSLVFATSPTLVTPALGTPSSGTLTSCTGLPLTTGVTGTLPVTNGGTGTATSFTTGSVVFAGASGVYSQDNANLFWDDTNNRLGIGTSSPVASLNVVGTSFIDNYAAAPRFLSRRAQGTLASPTAATAGISLAEWLGVGYSGSAFGGVGAAGGMVLSSAEAFTATAQGNRLIFYTTPTGTITSTERMRIDSSGNVGIGTTSPTARLDVRTAAGTAAQMNLYSGDNTTVSKFSIGQFASIDWDIGLTSTSGNFQIGGLGGSVATAYSIVRTGTAVTTHAWNISGTERMRIDSSGNVGIGINPVASKLTIAGTTADTTAQATYVGTIQLNEANLTTPNAVGGIEFKTSVFSGVGYGSKIVGHNNGALLFATRVNSATFTETMRIDSAGNVGIGTTAPSAPLEVSGTVRFGSSNNVVSGGAQIQGKSTSNWNFGQLDLYRNSTNTANPRFIALMLDGDDRQSTTIGAYNAIWGAYDSSPTTSSTSAALNGAMVYAAYAGHRWVNNGTERMRIDSVGNISIGYGGAGAYRFDVKGINATAGGSEIVARFLNGASGTASTYIRVGSSTDNAGAFGSIVESAGNAALVFNTNASSVSTERMRIDSSGNVGIGTTSPSVVASSTTIDIRGTVGGALRFGSATTTGVLYATDSVVLLGTASNNPLLFTTGLNVERMRIDSSGNIGIGTSSPSSFGRLVSKQSADTGIASLGLVAQASSTDTYIGAGYHSTSDTLRLNASYISTGAFKPMSFWTSDTERMRIHSSGGVSIGNTTDSGAASLNVSGSISGGYIAHAAGTTAMAFGVDNVVRVTPNATATYTSTVPAAGAICVLSILTSGTTSYTITFGTGFKSTGTLATGTVSARYFNITFVSDGTNLIETSRTVAIA